VDHGRQARGRIRFARSPLATSETPKASLRTDLCARDAQIGRRSTSYIDWPSLMVRTFDIDILQCPRCDDRMAVIAAITQHEIIEKILTHLRLPLEPEILSDGHTFAYDITGQPLIDSELGHTLADIRVDFARQVSRRACRNILDRSRSMPPLALNGALRRVRDRDTSRADPPCDRLAAADLKARKSSW
jgi:hypothetical protein